MTFWDVWLVLREERRSDAGATAHAMVERGRLLEQVESIIAQAEDASPAKTGISKKDLGTQIRENKQQEKRQERQQTAFKPAKARQEKPAEVIPLRGERQEDYSFPDLSDLIFKEDEDD
jgi:hypothetical protein